MKSPATILLKLSKKGGKTSEALKALCASIESQSAVGSATVANAAFSSSQTHTDKRSECVGLVDHEAREHAADRRLSFGDLQQLLWFCVLLERCAKHFGSGHDCRVFREVYVLKVTIQDAVYCRRSCIWNAFIYVIRT